MTTTQMISTRALTNAKSITHTTSGPLAPVALTLETTEPYLGKLLSRDGYRVSSVAKSMYNLQQRHVDYHGPSHFSQFVGMLVRRNCTSFLLTSLTNPRDRIVDCSSSSSVSLSFCCIFADFLTSLLVYSVA